jgi:DNA polymerase phi
MATTTLPLYWNLSSAQTEERIDASVKLVTALEQFQEQFLASLPDTSTDQSHDDSVDVHLKNLDASNAADVSYAVKRLIRGLASPRDSSRQGFAVALTEVRCRYSS